MTQVATAYSSYKHSSAAWLGDVPTHWQILPQRALFEEIKERNRPDEQMLSVTITQGVIKQRELLEGTSKKDGSKLDRSAYKLVCPGDIAYNKMRAWQGAVGASELRGIVSPAYVVVRLRDTNLPRYFHYLFRTPAFAKEAERWSYGITSDMWSLRPEHFKLIQICVPPKEEQEAIVRFLDHADRCIRRYIAVKRKLISLLNAQKLLVIHDAISRGLDPAGVLRPSGVEWWGSIPEHWEMHRLQELTDRQRPIMYGIVLPGPNVDSGVYIVKGGNCEPGKLRPEFLSRTTVAIESAYARSRLRKSDLVIAIRGGVGAVELVPEELTGANLTQDAARIAPRPGVHPGWLLYAVRSPVFQQHLAARILGATISGINIRDLKRIALPVPTLEEQSAIASHLDGALAGLNGAITRATREGELLSQYRTRLIVDVVTGKLDVRDAAGRFPQEQAGVSAESGEFTEAETELVDDPEAEVEEAEA